MSLPKRQERTAQLVAADELSDRQITARMKICKFTLQQWRAKEAFARRVEEYREAFARQHMAEWIALRPNRIKNYNERHRLLRQVMAERAKDMRGVPGGKTGLLIRTIKGIGRGEDFREVEEYAVDGVLLRAMLELERQAAQEMGQWLGKRKMDVKEIDAAIERELRRIAGDDGSGSGDDVAASPADAATRADDSTVH